MRVQGWIGAAVAVMGGAAAWACGGTADSTSGPSSSGYVIEIAGMSFLPPDLHVPPGTTVYVLNVDSMPHSVTSESRTNAFTHGSVAGVSFDTGPFTGIRSFTIAPGVANGTTIPYYCRTHLGGMVTPNGTITVDASAAPLLQ